MSTDFIAGFIAGAAQISSSYPFDSIKTRLQAERSNHKLRAGILDTFKKTIKYEGLPGLYKGMASPLVGIAGLNSILFSANGYCKKLLKGKSETELPLYYIGISGAFAGIAQAYPACVVELVKTKLQIQYVHGESQSSKVVGRRALALKGPIDVIRQVVTVEGLPGLFKGATPTLVRESLGFAAFFVGFEFLTQQAQHMMQVENVSPLMTMVCGGASGVLYWSACLAPDTIKTLMQGQPLGKPIYTGPIDCMKRLYKSEGVAGFYRGYTPAMVRAIPAASSTFLVYTFVKKYLEQ